MAAPKTTWTVHEDLTVEADALRTRLIECVKTGTLEPALAAKLTQELTRRRPISNDVVTRLAFVTLRRALGMPAN